MIDTHCHLVPGVDDGPATEAEAVDLARALAAQGVRRILCTPHFSSMFPTVHADVVERLESLRGRLAAEGVPVEVSAAAEITPAAAVGSPLEEITARSVNGRYAVIELLADSSPAALGAVVERLEEAGLRAVFAHPERCRAVQRHLDILDALRKDGALLQVVAPSLLGRWGRETEATAWRLIDTGRVDLLGSDAHGTRRRRPHLREACDLVAERLGPAVVEELTERRAQAVLDGRPE